MSNILEAEPVLAFGPRKPGTRRRYTAEQTKMILEEAVTIRRRSGGGRRDAASRVARCSPGVWQQAVDGAVA